MTKAKDQHDTITNRLAVLVDASLTNTLSLVDRLTERLNNLIIKLPDPVKLPPISGVVEELKRAVLTPQQAVLEVNHRGYRTSNGTGYQLGIISRWMNGYGQNESE